MVLTPNTQLGRYEIRSKLGEGGMGEVYLAHDTMLERSVALKVLPANVASDQQRMKRFMQEARTASALNHPNIITIYEIANVDSTQFLATELVEGVTLRQRLAVGRLSRLEVFDVAMQTASALAAAHEAGIVHRDIKPENIMLRHDGLVKVLDFGLAKLTEKAKAQLADTDALTWAMPNTTPGFVMGTVNYMSPEQAAGLKNIDERTDIWSLGVVIYEMVAQRVPFGFNDATPIQIISLIIQKEAPPLREYAHEISDELNRIVMKALETLPEDRYQNVKELLVDLRRLNKQLERRADLERSLSPEKSSAELKSTGARSAYTSELGAPRPTSSAEYLVSEIKNHKRVALVLATVIIAVAGVSFGLFQSFRGNYSSAPFQALKISRLTSTGKALWTSLSISPDGKYIVYVADDDNQQSLWVKHLATSSNVQIAPPAEVQYRGVTFSRDGNYIYYASSNKNDLIGALYQIPVLGGTARKLLDGIDGSVTFSPDGKRLAFVREYLNKGERALIIANADGTGEQKLVVRKNPDYFVRRGPAWSPDGKIIACPAGSNIGSYQNIVEVQVEGGTEKPISSHRFVEVGQVSWMPDGSGLLMSAAERRPSPSQIYYLSYPGGELRRITNDLNHYYGVSMTADLTALVAVQQEVPSRIWVAPNGEASGAKQMTSGRSDGAEGLNWTPDNRIVYESTAGGSNDLWIMNLDGTNQKQLTVPVATEGSRPNVANSSPSVSPDGRFIVFQSNSTGNFDIWRMDINGGNLKQLTNKGSEFSPDCSPNSPWVVYTSNSSGKDNLYRVGIDGGNPVQLTDKPSMYPAISPNGKSIACYYGDAEKNSPWKIALIPLEGGMPTRLLDVPPTVDIDATLRWTPDGRAIAYVVTREGISNIWSQAVDGSPAKQLTYFNADRIFRFAWSRDGKHLACSRGNATSDVILMNNSK